MEQSNEKSREHERYIVRIINTDLDGTKAIGRAMRRIRGVNFMLANAVCSLARVSQSKKAGALSDEEIKRIEGVLYSPKSHGVPSWMLNRRKDYESGDDIHLFTGDLKFMRDNDIKRLKKIRAYRGFRHAAGLPVRGQRTRSNFRKNKGKVTGVKKKSLPSAK